MTCRFAHEKGRGGGAAGATLGKRPPPPAVVEGLVGAPLKRTVVEPGGGAPAIGGGPDAGWQGGGPDAWHVGPPATAADAAWQQGAVTPLPGIPTSRKVGGNAGWDSGPPGWEPAPMADPGGWAPAPVPLNDHSAAAWAPPPDASAAAAPAAAATAGISVREALHALRALKLPEQEEDAVVEAVLGEDTKLLALVEVYAANPSRLTKYVRRHLGLVSREC